VPVKDSAARVGCRDDDVGRSRTSRDRPRAAVIVVAVAVAVARCFVVV
jgi:hypothetical protein